MDSKTQIELLNVFRPLIKEELSTYGADWWRTKVHPHVSYWNMGTSRLAGDSYLNQLDFAETVRVLMGNWNHFEHRYGLERRFYWMLAHLKQARNAASHLTRTPEVYWAEYDGVACSIARSMVQRINSLRNMLRNEHVETRRNHAANHSGCETAHG